MKRSDGFPIGYPDEAIHKEEFVGVSPAPTFGRLRRRSVQSPGLSFRHGLPGIVAQCRD